MLVVDDVEVEVDVLVVVGVKVAVAVEVDVDVEDEVVVVGGASVVLQVPHNTGHMLSKISFKPSTAHNGFVNPRQTSISLDPLHVEALVVVTVELLVDVLVVEAVLVVVDVELEVLVTVLVLVTQESHMAPHSLRMRRETPSVGSNLIPFLASSQAPSGSSGQKRLSGPVLHMVVVCDVVTVVVSHFVLLHMFGHHVKTCSATQSVADNLSHTDLSGPQYGPVEVDMPVVDVAVDVLVLVEVVVLVAVEVEGVVVHELHVTGHKARFALAVGSSSGPSQSYS